MFCWLSMAPWPASCKVCIFGAAVCAARCLRTILHVFLIWGSRGKLVDSQNYQDELAADWPPDGETKFVSWLREWNHVSDARKSVQTGNEVCIAWNVAGLLHKPLLGFERMEWRHSVYIISLENLLKSQGPSGPQAPRSSDPQVLMIHTLRSSLSSVFWAFWRCCCWFVYA